MQKGRYYLGRVMKIGELNQNSLMDAICNAPTIKIGKYDWTITDVEDHRADESPYVFGKLSKYARDGHTKVVDEERRSQTDSEVPNKLEASAPFIYLPNYSGISYLHVWNGIQEDVFPRRFREIIEAAYDNFFVGCEIEPVSDYRKFTTRISKLSRLDEISANIYPPNPLFGRLWESLKIYINDRNASEISIKETSKKSDGIKTQVVALMNGISKNSNFTPINPVAITDAAILMAADGYGKAKITGIENGQVVVIKTSDSQKSFLHPKEPIAIELAKTTAAQLQQVSTERNMDH